MAAPKLIKLMVVIPADVGISDDRAEWYLEHAIRGYWQVFAHPGDDIRKMSKATVTVDHSQIPQEQKGRFGGEEG
jgi:hypothetical protein